MAIYHLSGSIIARSQGRSAVACAAYRSGEKLYDERYQKLQDYTQKKDIVFKEILTPHNAPGWLCDREKLWNAVEACEKRKDAQLAREFNISLPRELTLSQNLELAKTFVQEQFVSKGMIADLCVHADKNKEGEWLYHAHIMLTLRELTESGFGKKVRAWNEKSKLLGWRAAWSEIANKYLALNGHDLRIDHRTLRAQEIPLEPQSKIGPKQSWSQSSRVGEHQRIARENGERLFEFSNIALDALTQQQSTFTHQDLARFVNRHTVDVKQFERVYEKVKHAEEIVRLGLDEQKRERFTTQKMLILETKLIQTAKALSEWDGHYVKKTAAETALTSQRLSTEQKTVFAYLLEPESLRCVIGYAGTGKSTLLGVARAAWEGSGFQVQGASLSGIAAQSLEGSSGIRSSTVASFIYHWDKGEGRLDEKTILVVDEAGMLGSRQMARLVNEVREAGAKLVLVGDPQQLQAIQAGAAFRGILEATHYLELNEVRRQRIPWQKEATQLLARGQVAEALKHYARASHLHEYATQSLAQQALVALWNDTRISAPHQTQIMLAYTKQAVQELNEQARGLRQAQGELGKEFCFETAKGKRFFAENDRIYFLKNERSLKVMNGSLGTITGIKPDELQVALDSVSPKEAPRQIKVDLHFYNSLDHGYAATIHKAQGVTVDRSYVLGSRYFDAHAAYVALSRHRESVELFWSREEFPKVQDLVRAFSRDRSKEMSIDYLSQDFARQRGMEQPYHSYASDISRPIHQPELKSTFSQSDPLKAFRAQYEREHPEQAKALLDKIRPGYEKMALLAEERLLGLEKAAERHPAAIDSLKQEALRVAKQTQVMDYLKSHNRELSQKIDRWVQLDMGQKSLERERGFER